MSTDIAKKDRLVTLKESDALQASTITISHEQMDLIKRTIAADATPEELDLFLFDCRRQGVHPLDKLLHFSVRTNKRTNKRTYTPITSIDLARIRAHDTGECAGIGDPTYGSDDEDRWATCTVSRLDRTNTPRPYTATARWSEYDPGDGPEGFMYRKMPKLMLGKCAEMLALRKAFPKQLHGLYVREEMAQAGNEVGGRGGTDPNPRTMARDGSPEPRTEGATGQRGNIAPADPIPVVPYEATEEEARNLFPTPDVKRDDLLKNVRVAQTKVGPKSFHKTKEALGIEAEKPLDKLSTNDLQTYLRHLEAGA